MARRLRNLFVLNERVALSGTWKHGFFSLVPVGATNVGSIILNHDQSFQSNRTNLQVGQITEKTVKLALNKGQEIGGFRLGSTVVLVFQANSGFKFNIKPGQRVKMGDVL
jgi:phosphatidylserine decarboxylase